MADFEAYFVDIGEGDSSLLKLPGDQWALIDVFRSEGRGIDLFKLLDDRLPPGEGDKLRLEYLIITHAHDDHIRGLSDLVERYEIGAIWAPRYNTEDSLGDLFDEFQKVMTDHEDIVVVPKGSRAPFAYIGEDESVEVRVFSPPGYVDVEEELDDQEQRDKVHQFCGVYRFSYEGVSVMFTGDSDLTCGQRIIGYYDDVTDDNDLTVVDSTVLHASHHGSYTFFKDSMDDDETWTEGLEVIKPEAVVISVGSKNTYGHPHKVAVDAYEDETKANSGSSWVERTDESGTLVLNVEENGNWTLAPDDGAIAQTCGWDDDDDDGGSDAGSGGGSGNRSAAARRRTRTRVDSSSAA